MRNVLTEWKKEAELMSSDILLNTPFYKEDIKKVYNTLSQYFKLDYFNINTATKFNWLYFLLVNPKSIACVLNLFEVATIIEEIKSFPKARREKIKAKINNPDHLRETFFEIYMQLVFKFNKYTVRNDIVDNNKLLDLVLYDDGQEYLIECTKLYMPHNERMEVLFRIQSKIMELINLDNNNLVVIPDGVLNSVEN